jgi:uncharacterized protein
MAVYFVDSSALVKRYINETGSQWILNLCNPASKHDIVIAAIAGVEITAAITRRAKGGSIDSEDATALCHQFRIDLETEYQVIEISDRIIAAAMNLAQAQGLRGYDAVQLAAACAVNSLCIEKSLPSVTLVSADNELNEAAIREGLKVENPSHYL